MLMLHARRHVSPSLLALILLLPSLSLLGGCFGHRFGQRSLGGSSFQYTTAACNGLYGSALESCYRQYSSDNPFVGEQFTSSMAVAYTLAMSAGVTSASVGDERGKGVSLDMFLELYAGRNGVGLGGRFGAIAEIIEIDDVQKSFFGLGPTALAYYQLTPSVLSYAGLGWFPLLGKTSYAPSTGLRDDGSRESSAFRPLVGLRYSAFSLLNWEYLLALEGAYLYGYGSGPEPVYTGGLSLLFSGMIGW